MSRSEKRKRGRKLDREQKEVPAIWASGKEPETRVGMEGR